MAVGCHGGRVEMIGMRCSSGGVGKKGRMIEEL